jgi:hypothetical protein
MPPEIYSHSASVTGSGTHWQPYSSKGPNGDLMPEYVRSLVVVLLIATAVFLVAIEAQLQPASCRPEPTSGGVHQLSSLSRLVCASSPQDSGSLPCRPAPLLDFVLVSPPREQRSPPIVLR